MKITAMLAFWDEPPSRLYRCVKSAGQLADHIVAADGPFALFPHTRLTSPRAALDAIKKAADETDTTVKFLKGREWAGQTAKRDAIMKACKPSDWVFYLDADDVLVECDREGVRKELADTDADVMIVERYTPVNPKARWRPDAGDDEREDATIALPRLFRYLDDMRVEYAHWVYTGARNGERVALWGPKTGAINGNPLPPLVLQRKIKALLRFEHHQTWRSDAYRRNQLDYRKAREVQVRKTGSEA